MATAKKPSSPAVIQKQVSLLRYIQAIKSPDCGIERRLAVIGRDAAMRQHAGRGKRTQNGGNSALPAAEGRRREQPKEDLKVYDLEGVGGWFG